MRRNSTESSVPVFLTGVVAALALLALVIPVVYAFWPRVTPANYQRIQIGMTTDEVVDILGKPTFDTTEYGIVSETGAYGTNDSLTVKEKLAIGYRKHRRLQWGGRSGDFIIVVVFDSDGLVATKYL